jgi:pimeloyl-ACP methyl ester carboxylesterase
VAVPVPPPDARRVEEQTRARYPDAEGFVERDGVRVFWERYGDGDPTILFLPAWSVCYSRLWKAQIPYFARHYRVLVFDPRGNGRSDKPPNPEDYADVEIANDAFAVMDATGTERAIVVGASMGGWYGALMPGLRPDRIEGAFLMCPATALGETLAERQEQAFMDELETEEGWRGKFNRHYWLRDFGGFADFFAAKVVSDPHSTKQVEDFAGWIRETTPESLIASACAPFSSREDQLEIYGRITCPVVVVHGDADEVMAHNKGVAVANAIGASFINLDGVGHAPAARKPVQMNLLIREFVESVLETRRARETRGYAVVP